MSDSSNDGSLTFDARHVSDLPVGLGKFFRSPTFEIPVRDRKSFIAPFGKSETYRASGVKDPSLLESLIGAGDILFVESHSKQRKACLLLPEGTLFRVKLNRTT